MRLPVIAAAPSSACRAERGRVGSPKAVKDVGSFMSCQNPAKPCPSRSSYRPPHHLRTRACVKSGKTDSPAHATPRTVRPEASRTNASTADPLSYTALPGAAFTAGSTIDTSRIPSRRSSSASCGSFGNRSWSTVNTWWSS